MFAQIALTLVPILKGHGKEGGQGTGPKPGRKKKGREAEKCTGAVEREGGNRSWGEERL